MNSVVVFTHGPILSLVDLAASAYDSKLKCQPDRKWIHFKNEDIGSGKNAHLQGNSDLNYFYGTQDNEIREVHFIGINPKSCLTMLLVPQSKKYLRQAIYYPYMERKQVRALAQVFQVPQGMKITRIQNNFNYAKYKEVGETQMQQYIEVRHDSKENRPVQVYKVT